MDFYTNHRLMEAEAKRKIAEMRSMATDYSVLGKQEEEEDAEQRTQRYFQWFAERLAALAHRPHLGQT